MGKRLLIGVIITDCYVDFQAEILRGIISQAFKSNCDVAVIAPLHNFSVKSLHKDTEKQLFNLILSEKFDGFIYDRLTFYRDDIKEHIDDLCSRTGKPVMLLDYSSHKSFETTSVDDCDAFETITDHLITVHGKKKIYCLTGPKKIFNSEERLRGYMNAMKEHGLYFDRSYYEYGDFWKGAAKRFADRIISGELERPEAVVCGNDISAVELTEELIANGIRVPEDIAVTGYDASMDGYHANPSITSYSRPNFQLGAESFRRLYRIITGKICLKVPSENGKLRLGRSCGCTESPQIRHSIQRMMKINSSNEGYLLYGDMLFDITNTDNIALFAERLDNYTFFLYKMRRLRICLTKKYIDSLSSSQLEELSFNAGDEACVVLAKSAVKREAESMEYFHSSDLLPDFGDENRKHPTAFYLSPLHYNGNFFGYSAVSFGKEPVSFSPLYPKWINYVNVALEQVRIKSITKNVIQNTSQALLYDKVTGMLSRSGIEHEFSNLAAAAQFSGRTAYFIVIDMQGIKKTYYRSGEETRNQTAAAFSKILRSCLKDSEICGIWSTDMMCVITLDEGREKDIYEALLHKMSESAFSPDESCNIDFSIGLHAEELRGGMDFSNAIYKASINTVQNYSISDSRANPQFEKLCMLRSKMIKNPELPWNISEIAESLYLSKSYLQKIYKSYFNKSIIEEMIRFRIDKAKELLSSTDMTVTEISRECGYSSYNYFVRQFRMCEGASPSEYREKCRAENSAGSTTRP